jgi:pantoate--beta-alanine ligase
MNVVQTFEDVRAIEEGSVALVPTMGYLHEGHLSLIREASRLADTVVVSIFVNPLQFGEARDLDTYPRDVDRDTALAAEAGATVVFAPSAEYMYPDVPETTVSVGAVSEGMEGSARPGHFAGVATVVAKLFAGVQPHSAYFGRKDAQQLAVVSTMAADLSFPVAVTGLPVVRETDGLALSSRNVRLDGVSRERARALSQGLMGAADAFEAGEASVSTLKDIAAERMDSHDGVDVEYIELADARTASISSTLAGVQFLATAARVGDVRLIDNVTFDSSTRTADRGVRLAHPSILYGGG